MSLPPNTRKPEDLTEFTFGHYNALICNKYNRHVFEPVFDKIKDLVDNDFKEIADLRNAVFHSKRGITRRDIDQLKRFRRQMQHNRESYRKTLSQES